MVPHVCVGAVGFSRRMAQAARWRSVDSSAPLLTRTSNIDRNNQLTICINQWVTTNPTNLCTRCTCENLCLGRKCSWCTVRNYKNSTVAAGAFCCHLRQHHHARRSRAFTPVSFPTRVLTSPERIVDSSLNPSQGIFPLIPVQCTCVWKFRV